MGCYKGKTRPTYLTLSTLDSRMALDHTYLTWSAYSNLLWSCQQWCTEPLLPRKKDSRHNPQHDGWSIRGSVPNFSPELAIEAVEVKPPSVDVRLLDLLDPYHQHVIGTFNTFSRGPTHRSLIDTSGGYDLWSAGLPHHTTQPSQPTVLPYPPKGPARSPV
jgi:hypothetical protein